MIKFFFNGQLFFCNKPTKITLTEIINYFNCQNEVIILEYNKVIYNRSNWKKILIVNNDKIELITIVGGG